jgi:hypothetical protein
VSIALAKPWALRPRWRIMVRTSAPRCSRNAVSAVRNLPLLKNRALIAMRSAPHSQGSKGGVRVYGQILAILESPL